jgi:hypothetical protein
LDEHYSAATNSDAKSKPDAISKRSFANNDGFPGRFA